MVDIEMLFILKMFYVYILYSESLDKYYIGYTSVAIEMRIERHLNNYYSNHYTKIANDWKLFWSLECENQFQALKIENHIKKMKSRKFSTAHMLRLSWPTGPPCCHSNSIEQ